jgi:cell division septum initiation protein DivIVA
VSYKDRLRRSNLETTTSERLAAIVEAAESAAAKVIDDAEAEARRYLSEAQAEAEEIVAERVSSLAAATDSLIAQAEAIRVQAERLIESLAEAKAQLGAGGGGAEGAAGQREGGARGSHLIAVAPVEEAEEPSTEREDPVGARLLATQMAVSGNSREEIAARLRNGFEIDDTDAILDAILGPED